MIWYNIKTAVRYLTSHKNISLLNLLGLSIGMSVAILIFYFVNFERSYDNFHKDSNLIYRIISVEKGTTGTDYRATTPLPLPEAIHSDIKDADLSTGLSHFLFEDEPVQVENQTFFNLTGYTADSNFLRIFNFPLLSGNPNTVFEDINSVLLTSTTAKKLFGNGNPSGKEITINKQRFTVAGIMKDLPENSDFKFNLLVSHLVLNKLHPDLSRLWWWGGAVTFVKIRPNQNIESIRTSLSSIPDKYFPDFLKGRETYDIQPLESIHLDKRVSGNAKPPISLDYLNILLFIAIAVLFIACANFVNLSTSQSEKRAMETGIRKLSGGSRFQIICLFLGESVSLSMIALVVAVYLAILFLPWFNVLSQRNITIDFANSKIVLFILLFGIITGILSGIYPALVFSKYRPVQMLHSRLIIHGNKTGLKNGFIIAQFLITILLITVQLFITKQVLFLRNHDLGFKEEDLMSIPLYYYDENKRLAFAKLFAETMEKESAAYGISGVTLSENVPGQNFPNKFAVIPEGSSPDDSKEMIVTSIDEHFAGVFEIPLERGRILSDTIPSDRINNVIINETAALEMGWAQPVGRRLRFKHEKEPFTVVGILKDINFRSLQSRIEPVVYRYAGENWLAGYLTVRIVHSRLASAIKFVNSSWEKSAPGVPFQYFFIKDKYLEGYKAEERLAKIVGTFALLAIFLSCLGLVAMTAYLSIRRTKEIGIRKIHGSKTISVMLMLSTGFVKITAIAYVIACPIAWYIMHKWLQSFAYQTVLSWWIFGLAGIISLLIVQITVSWQSWRAATRNPVEALRYE